MSEHDNLVNPLEPYKNTYNILTEIIPFADVLFTSPCSSTAEKNYKKNEEIILHRKRHLEAGGINTLPHLTPYN